MKLVQIGASRQGGSYYFSTESEEFYHISNELLMEINHVRPVCSLLWLIFSLAVGIGIMSLPEKLFMGGDFMRLIKCIFAIAAVSSLGICHIIRVNEKRKQDWILENLSPLEKNEELFKDIKGANREYIKLSFAAAVFFIISISQIFLLYGEQNLVIAVFLVADLDFLFMLLAVLAPLKKLSVLPKLRKLKKLYM